MKKLFRLLLGFSVLFMVACGSSYQKNPHLSKINDDVSAAKMQIKEKSYSGFTSDSKPEEKTYGDEEEKLVDDILHIKYNYLPIYQIIFEISAQLDSSCDVIILYNEHSQMGGVHFIWNEKEDMVTLSIPITKRNKKYLIMELSEVASSTMKSIDNKKELSLEEKERIKAVGYKQAWTPTLYTTFNGEGKEVSLEGIKSLDEIRDLVKSLNQKKEIIYNNTQKDDFSKLNRVGYDTYYNGNFGKDVKNSIDNSDGATNKILIHYLYELENSMMYAHMPEANIEEMSNYFKEKYSSYKVSEIIYSETGEDVLYILVAESGKEEVAELTFYLTIKNTKNGQEVSCYGDSAVSFQGPTSKTEFWDIDAVRALYE